MERVKFQLKKVNLNPLPGKTTKIGHLVASSLNSSYKFQM